MKFLDVKVLKAFLYTFLLTVLVPLVLELLTKQENVEKLGFTPFAAAVIVGLVLAVRRYFIEKKTE